MSKLRKIKIDDQAYLYGIKKGFDHEARNELVSFRGYLDGFKTSPFVVEFNGAQNPRIIGVYIHFEGTTNAYEPNVAEKFIRFEIGRAHV